VTIDRNSDGESIGIFIDQNTYPTVEFNLMRVVPRFTHAQTVEALKRSMVLYDSAGTTGTYERHRVAPEIVRAYKEVWDSGAATVRSHLALNPVWESTAEAEQDMEQWAYTASGSGFGQTRNDAGRFQEFTHLAARHNLRVNTLVRDTLEEVLTIFEEAHGVTPIDDRRWVNNRVLQASPQQLQRINKLGLVVETIPLTELWLRASKFVDQPDLADSAVSHRRYGDMVVQYAFGTDNKPYSPFATLWAAVARTERSTGTVLGPEQCLSRMTLCAHFCF